MKNYYKVKHFEDNRDKEGKWILDGGRMVIAYKYKCPFCHDRDTAPKPFCHGCGARLKLEINDDGE